MIFGYFCTLSLCCFIPPESKPIGGSDCLIVCNDLAKEKNTMKKLIQIACCVTLFAVMLFGAANIEAKPKGKPSMKFAETVHDFGMVKEDGGPVSCEFDFVNDGEGNLVIYDATADCGCTRPDYPKAPVAPGKSGKIKVVYNPLGRPGGFTKVITIKSNGSPSKTRVKIRGTVVPKK